MLVRRRFYVKISFFVTIVAHRKALVFLAEQFDVGSGDTLSLTSTTHLHISTQNRQERPDDKECISAFPIAWLLTSSRVSTHTVTT